MASDVFQGFFLTCSLPSMILRPLLMAIDRKARIGIKRLGAVANKMRKQSSMNRAVRPRWLKCVSCCRWRVFQDTIKPFRTTVLVSVLLLKDKLRLQLTSRKAKSREL